MNCGDAAAATRIFRGDESMPRPRRGDPVETSRGDAAAATWIFLGDNSHSHQVPNASFVGHLGGLATGSLEAGGYMTWLLPPAAGLDARLAGLPGYAVAGDENVRAASGLGDLLRFARHVVTFLAGLVGLDRCTAAARRRFGECWAHAAEKPPELAKAAVGATADV